jgi:PKD repeat protein
LVKDDIPLTNMKFDINPNYGEAPLETYYSCNVEGGVGPVGYTITFGDGTSVKSISGQKTYSNEGNFEATCTAKDALGKTLSSTINVQVIKKEEPNPFTFIELNVYPESGVSPLEVQYWCYAVGGNYPVSYVVDFGDGSSSAVKDGVKTYSNDGSYTIRCTATDSIGQTISAEKLIVVEPVVSELITHFSVSPLEGFAPLEISYSCSASGGSQPYSYSIQFGDGSGNIDSVGSYVYTIPGDYVATCLVHDGSGQAASKNINVKVNAKSTPFTGIDLSISPKEGFSPLTIQYSCEAYGGMSPVSYAISFGDGSTSTSKQGSKTYTAPGDYKVTCTAIDALHFQISKSDYVNVKEDKPLLVSLNVNPNEGFAPLEVAYQCSASGNDPLTYKINFGDGTSSSNNVGKKTYNNAGTYQLSCEVTDAKGTVQSVSKSVFVKEDIPLNNIQFSINPNYGEAPLDTYYSCNVEGGVGPVDYTITFGDGTSVKSSSGQKTYSNEGNYEATCTAKDALGKTLSSTINVQVIKKAEPNPFTFIDLNVYPDSGFAPLDVQYWCYAVGGSYPVSYVVDFGDGTSSVVKDGVKTYSNAGSFTMRCTATDSLGQTISAEKNIVVDSAVQELTIDFSVSPVEGFAPLEVQYSCSASGGIGPYSYAINFGDGSGNIDSSGSYVYTYSGEFVVTCLVYDGSGQAASKSVTVKVNTQPDPLYAYLNVYPTEGFAPLYVSYSCTAVGGVAPYVYSVSLGDGTINSQRGTKLYTIPGTYTIKCLVTDSLGETAVVEQMIKVNADLPLTVNLNVNPQEGFTPLNVNYQCSASGNGPISYQLSFGDNTNSNNPLGTKTYYNTGNYEIACTATDAYGRSKTESKTVLVKEFKQFESISFAVNPTEGDAPLHISYSCNAVGGNNPISYVVEFGDGEYATSNQGTYTYENVGTYIAKCIARDSVGESISKDQQIIVKEPYYDVDFDSILLNVNPTQGDAPLIVSYSCEVRGGNDPVTLTMQFSSDISSATNGRYTSGDFLYNTPGTYVMKCIAEDNDGDTIMSQKTIVVTRYDPRDWNIWAIPQSGKAPLTVTFEADTSQFVLSSPIKWDFKTGHVAYGQKVIHTFTRKGVYEVTASFTDEYGVFRQKSLTINVEEPEKEEYISAENLRITGFIAEVVNNRLYVTANVENNYKYGLNDLKVQLMIPDFNMFEVQTIRTLRSFEKTSVSFIVPMDEKNIDTFVILTVSGDGIYKREIRPLIG